MTEQPTITETLIAGRYQLRQALPPGAICAVYLGDDTILRRPVAAKVVPPAHVAAYQAAVRATALIAHPAMVLILDAIAHDGMYVLVEEYVGGVTLATQLERGLTSERTINLGLQLARLLAYTHQRDVVHGDLTPAAVIIERDGTARVNNFQLPPDQAYFARSIEIESQLARGTGELEAPEQGPLPALTSPAGDLRAIGLLLAQGLTTASPSGNVRAFGADVPADMREVVARLVLRGHPRPLTDIHELLAALERARAAVEQRADDPQDTPVAVRQHRAIVDQMPWSEAETQLNVPLWQPGFGPGTPPGTGHHPAAPGLAPLRAPVPTGPFDGPGVPGVPPANWPIDQQYTVPTPLPLAPAPPSGGVRAAGPSGPLRAPSMSGPLRAPGPSGPLRAPTPSGPLRAPTPSGPLRAPTPSGPLRAPTPSGSLQMRNPTGPMRAVWPSGPSGPLRAPSMSGPLRAPTPSGQLRYPSSAPLPQRAPTPSGALSRTTPTGSLRAYGNVPPIQSYRVPAPIPWNDDPQVQQWVESAGSQPLRLSRPMMRPGNIGWLTTVLIGLLLFAICFAVGYFMPIILPLH